ncbi:unnamed protein product [Didymodactylos carnosus]|uniref:G-protein coupled receptors family 1 profile domain-containing protein n=1 Tax=Didymodactylos carnosus TaxID=1234261 RepID=A0A815G2N5_9BILA|nr:unnamed protein product [Didymodactylos carnosus]CAF1333081.1 unnamed protein product [Didymodactylos carnosus]CAF4086088.1 unnamed protein product [Didymodactylos carnosus]CAF4188292.1 unnamed protein product [Didymodactylos carnosus]
MNGRKPSQNEIYLIYHYHDCLIKQEPQFFVKYYKFIYNGKIGLNRYTSLLVFGSILPSVVTVVCNIVCVKRVINIKIKTTNLFHRTRNNRRQDEARRILIIITIECFLTILNSWFIDLLVGFIYCKRNLFIGNDCPLFLKKYYDLTTIIDFLNSITNIFIHCLCTKLFRQELLQMFTCNSQMIHIKRRGTRSTTNKI